MKSLFSILALIVLTGCAAKRPVYVPHVPYRAHFDPAHCHYLPDGIKFRCKDVIFDPTEINAKDHQ